MKGRQPEKEERTGEAIGSDREGRVGDWWSEEAEKRASGGAPRIDWSTSPAIARVTNRRTSGAEDRNWLGWIHTEFIHESLELGLSIGCGSGLLERDVLGQGLCSRMEGLDIAAGALEIARRLGAGLAITYNRHNLESESLPRRRYDIVFSAGVLHHVYDLEFCVGELHAALKEGGLLALSEFRGPARFQWTGVQLEPVSVVYSFLPWYYRYNYLVDGTVPYPRRPQICSMLGDDPSEAVRSNEMLEVVERFFERVGRREIGGTLLNPLLAGIVENFDEENELDLGFLMLVAELEGLLIEAGAIPSDFVVDVYRRRPEPLAPGNAELGRVSLIRNQENLVEEALARAVEIRDENEETRRRIEGTERRAGELGAEVARLQSENARLKTGPFFAAARLAKRLAGRTEHPRAHPDSFSTSGEPAGMAFLALSSQSEVCVPAGREAAAIARYVDGIAGGTESLWLRWLSEIAVIRGGRALAVGLEPAMVEMARRLGICEEADIAEVHALGQEEVLSIKAPAPGGPPPEYDLVFLDLSGCSNDPASAARVVGSAVADGGTLVAISMMPTGVALLPGEEKRLRWLMECLPESWRVNAGDTRGFRGGVSPDELLEIERSFLKEYTLEAERGFGTVASEAARCALAGRRPSGMERALACLLIYAETLLIDRAILTPSFRVKVYRKGPGRIKHIERQARYDIIRVQELEIERLQRMLEFELERRRRLSNDLAVEVENLDRAARDLERLTEERELLKKRGPARYWGILMSKVNSRSGGP